jgi:ATP-dependent RNA helicase DDX49/DBP8
LRSSSRYSNLNIRLATVIGGLDFTAQALELSRIPHIIIATPGRLANHLETNPDIRLKRAKYLVLDEADRLFEECFVEPIGTIVSRMAPRDERQTLMFTATLTEDILTLGQRKDSKGNTPFVHQCDSNLLSVAKGLEQSYMLMPSHVRDAHLLILLKDQIEKDAKSTVIIFVGRCQTAETLRVMLQELQLDCVALHSKLNQNQRLASLAKFRGEKVRVLIATDVASRGLDIPQVRLVVNYDIPRDPVDYVHRVGRTARAGRAGHAVSLITERDVKLIESIEERIGTPLGSSITEV